MLNHYQLSPTNMYYQTLSNHDSPVLSFLSYSQGAKTNSAREAFGQESPYGLEVGASDHVVGDGAIASGGISIMYMEIDMEIDIDK